MNTLDENMTLLNRIKTTFPSMRPKEADWLRFLGIAMRFNLVHVNDSMQGRIIKDNMGNKPFETVCMVMDMYRDDPALTETIIGVNNIKLIK